MATTLYVRKKPDTIAASRQKNVVHKTEKDDVLPWQQHHLEEGFSGSNDVPRDQAYVKSVSRYVFMEESSMRLYPSIYHLRVWDTLASC